MLVLIRLLFIISAAVVTSGGARAEQLHFPVSVSSCSELLSLDSLKNYPILNRESDKALLMQWKALLEAHVQDPEQSFALLEQPVDLPGTVETLSLMLEKLKEISFGPNAYQENEYFQLSDLTFPETLPFYKDWKTPQFVALKQELERLIQKKVISYAELHKVSSDFAYQIYPVISIKWFNAKLGQYIKKLDGKPLVEGDFLATLNREVKFNGVVKHSFPFALALPTFESLSFKAINRYYGFPFLNIGLTDQVQTVDGFKMSPPEFFGHDFSHLSELQIYWIKFFFGESELLPTIRNLTAEKINLALTKMFEMNQTYGEYSLHLSDPAVFSKREQVIGEAIFFYFSHEAGRDAITFRTASDVIRAVQENLEKVIRGADSGLAGAFLNRLNNQRDLGQAFSSKARPRTKEELVVILEKILAQYAKSKP